MVDTTVHTTMRTRPAPGFLPASLRAAALALLVLAAIGGCSIDGTGLGPAPDGATGTGGTSACPAGLTEQASWPARSTSTTCARPCGPDDIGLQICSQTDRATCQAKAGCVCLEAPCVACAACALPPSECYQPTNATAATACANGVGEDRGCSPSCGRRLCLLADGKTACICNSQGKYACAAWSGTAWQ